MFIYVTVLAYNYVPFYRSYSYIQVLSTLPCSYHLNALAIYLKLSMTFAGCHHKMLPPVLWPLHSKELGDQAPEMPWLWCAIWPEWCPECLHLNREPADLALLLLINHVLLFCVQPGGCDPNAIPISEQTVYSKRLRNCSEQHSDSNGGALSWCGGDLAIPFWKACKA